jgi:large subunit ribosomal protein L36
VTLRLTQSTTEAPWTLEERNRDLCAMFPAQEVQGMKVRNSLRSLKAKDGSYVVRRRGRVFVMNKRAPRLKARQG